MFDVKVVQGGLFQVCVACEASTSGCTPCSGLAGNLPAAKPRPHRG